MARLTILTPQEIDALYAIPSLDDEERSFLFNLDAEDRAILDSFENGTARNINFILQLGYYRAVGNFFLFSFHKVKRDVEFILQQYFPGEPFPKRQVSKNHHYQNRCAVMNQFGLRDPDAGFQSQLLKEARVLAKRHMLSRFVLEELLVLLPIAKCAQACILKLTGHSIHCTSGGAEAFGHQALYRYRQTASWAIGQTVGQRRVVL